MKRGAKKGRPSPFRGHKHSLVTLRKMRKRAFQRWDDPVYRSHQMEARSKELK
jgi:hypothetical protein